MTFSLVILGAPRTKKTSNRLGWRYSRRLGRQVRVVLPSANWVRWVKTAMIRLLVPLPHAETFKPVGYMPAPFLGLHPLTTQRVRCAAKFYRDANRGDAVGYYQGLADLLEKRGVIKNDRQIVDWNGSELLKDSTRPRVELTLEVLD